MQPAQQPTQRAAARTRLIHMLAERLVREHQADAAKAKAGQASGGQRHG